MDKAKRGGIAAGRGTAAGRGGKATGGAGSSGAGASTSGAAAGGSKPSGGPGRGSSLAARGGVSKRGKGRGGGGAAAAADDDLDAGSSFTGWFTKDLRIMMYGFGDTVCPLDETVDLVEDITIEYLKEATLKASAIAADSLKARMDERDLLFSVRKDPAKFARVKELLLMQQVIKEARNSFKEVAEEGGEEEAAE